MQAAPRPAALYLGCVILVTGATGFIGSEVLRRASDRGWRVRGMSRRPERAGSLARLPHVELFRGDVADPDDLDEALEGVDAVVHLVGIIQPSKRQGFRTVHVEGTRRVIEAAGRAGIARYVHMSALGVEEGRVASEYFRTKAEGEEVVRASGLEATIFRPSIVVGRESDFLARLIPVVRWSPIVPVPMPGARLQPVWVGDVAECFLQAARAPSTPETTYEIAGPEIMTLRELVETLGRATGRTRVVVPVPTVLARLGAAAAELVLPSPPITREQLNMLALESVSDDEATRLLLRDFEIEHARLADRAPAWFDAS